MIIYKTKVLFNSVLIFRTGFNCAASNIISVVLELIALIVFPVMFIKDLDQKSAKMQISEWYFAWSYGIAWGAAIFEIGCAILLLIDKDNEEIYYKEKTTYREPEYGH